MVDESQQLGLVEADGEAGKARNKRVKTKCRLKVMLVALLFAAGLCVTGTSVQAAEQPIIEPRARALIERMAARYKSAHSYSDVMTLSSSGGKQIPKDAADEYQFRAQVVWKRPNKARIVKYAATGVAHSVSNGKILWAVTPRHKGYYLQRPADFNSINDAMNEIGVGAPGLGHIVEGQGVKWMVEQGLTSLKMGNAGIVDGAPVRRVIARFNFPSGGRAIETLVVGAKDSLLRSVTQEYISDKGRATFTERHTNIKLNPVLPDATFTFALPRGARRIDYYSRLDPDQDKPTVKVGDLLPSFQAVDLNGKPVSLDDYKDKAAIIHFFATWEATAGDVPEIVRLYNRYKDKGLAVVGVAMDARHERVTQLVAKEGVPYPVVFDGKAWDNSVAKKYGVRSLPTTLLVGRDGRLRKVAGRPWEAGFEEAVVAMLGEG
jgi:outer membrane lipoprotein-sorting protein/peroxiredoxin